jgi:predicted nucleotidyltransferase
MNKKISDINYEDFNKLEPCKCRRWFIRIISILLSDNWTEYTSTFEKLEQVPVKIKKSS